MTTPEPAQERATYTDGYTYVVIDRGEHPDDEPVAVGPFSTEDEAHAFGQGRDVLALLTFEQFAEMKAV